MSKAKTTKKQVIEVNLYFYTGFLIRFIKPTSFDCIKERTSQCQKIIKKNLNLKNPAKKIKPQSPNPKPLNQQEKLQKHQWINKPKKFKNNQLKLLKEKMESQKKLKSKNLLNKKVNKKSQKKSLKLNHQFKRLLFQRGRSNNQVNKVNHNNK
jgi:hypothetical protein